MSLTQDRINSAKQRITGIRNDIETIRGVDVSGQLQNLREIKSKIGELSVIKDKVKERFTFLKTSLKEIIDDIDNIDTDELNRKIKDILELVTILDNSDLDSLNTTIKELKDSIDNDGSGNDIPPSDNLGPNTDIGVFATTPPTTGGYKHPGSKKRSLKRTSKRRPNKTRSKNLNSKSKRRPKTIRSSKRK